MGTLSVTVANMIFDRMQSRVVAMVGSTYEDGLKDNTEEGFADYLRGAVAADPDVLAFLTAEAVNMDRQVLRENVYDYLHEAFSNDLWGKLIRQVNACVTAEVGGEYDDFASYWNTVGGSVPPLIGEIMMQHLGADVFDYASAPIGIMHPYMGTVDFDKAFVGTEGAEGDLTDETTDAGDVGAADVAFFAADDDVLLLGLRGKFNYLLGDLSTVASENADMTVKYWNGNAWTAVAGLVDNTTGFSVNDVLITWTMPDDWVPCNFDSQSDPGVSVAAASEEEMYYVAFKRTSDTMVTPPVATWFQTVPQAVLAPNGELWGGIAQPPLALVHITDTNECTTIPIQSAEHGRFVVPGTGNSEIVLTAMSAFAAENITYTMKYLDQDGNTAQAQSQGAWAAAIAAGDTHNGVIDGADTGLRSVDSGGTIVTANTTGVFAIGVNAYSRALGVK